MITKLILVNLVLAAQPKLETKIVFQDEEVPQFVVQLSPLPAQKRYTLSVEQPTAKTIDSHPAPASNFDGGNKK